MLSHFPCVCLEEDPSDESSGENENIDASGEDAGMLSGDDFGEFDSPYSFDSVHVHVVGN